MIKRLLIEIKYSKKIIIIIITIIILSTLIISLIKIGVIEKLFAFLVSVFASLIGAWMYSNFEKKEKKKEFKINHPELLKLNSWLNKNRIYEILSQYDYYIPRFNKQRHKYISKIAKKQNKNISSDKEFINKPAWYSISRTPSNKKYRLTLGFRNPGCSYWREDKNFVGCLNCGYGSSALQDIAITKLNLLNQFDFVRKWAFQERYDFDVIEFLNDGSFFNYEKEWPDGFPTTLFKLINDDKSIKRILIESRPEFITKEKIESLLKILNKGQTLEIGIGLETKDDFIRDVCIRKGYDLKDFENAVSIIKEFSRCEIVVYSIVKPVFLTEKESIKDIFKTFEYLTELSNKYSINIIHKLEPIVIAQGTLLELLYFHPRIESERYSILSYWSIVEIICEINYSFPEKCIRIGAREDMDIIEKVSGIYNDDGTFNQFDFWCYDAVQKYNSDCDIIKFLANIKLIIDLDNSFYQWKKNTGITRTYIKKSLKKYKTEINNYQQSETFKKNKLFLQSVFSVLDILELTEESKIFARKFRKKYPKITNEGTKELERYINDKFNLIPNVSASVQNYYHEKDNRKILRIYFDLINYNKQEKHDIWIGIPTI